VLQQNDIDIRMARKNPHQFTPAVPAKPDHTDRGAL
jgi:hypothetical protein